jgi:hypothetical protein
VMVVPVIVPSLDPQGFSEVAHPVSSWCRRVSSG